MSITKTLSRPIAWIASLHARKQRAKFLAAHTNTARTQQQLLDKMLAEFADTDFARDHKFSSISSYKDFINNVPIRSYEDMRPYINKVLAGNTTALIPASEKLHMFAMTSATTASAKYIPVTQGFLDDIRRGWNIFGISVLRDHPSAWLRCILQITSPACEKTSPTGLPCGAISGLLAKTQKKIVRRMYPAPAGCAEITDAQARFYTLLRFAAMKDVALITTANPSSTIKLIEVGQEHSERLIRDISDGTFCPPGDSSTQKRYFRIPKANPTLAKRIDSAVARDGKLLPKHLWNISFLTNWTGGTLKLYLPQLREMFGDIPIRDIGLVASEGRFSLPLSDNSPAGVAEITSNFLEFIPASQRSSNNPDILRAHELSLGDEYFIVFSNRTGFWRYDLDDRVRVVDHLGLTPIIEFLSRGQHTSSITGEKLTEHQVVEAMRLTGVLHLLSSEKFTLQGIFDHRPYYQLAIETCDSTDLQQLAFDFDKNLSKLNIEYKSKRESGRLGQIKPLRMKTGYFATIESQKIIAGARAEQYKHCYLIPVEQ